MKAKLLQILLGAIGSVLTVLIGHVASAPPDLIAGSALAAGPTATALLGNIVDGFAAG